MRRLLITLLLLAALLAVLVAPPLAGASTWQPALITEFTWGDGGSFAESMTADSHGNLWVSLTRWGTETVDNFGDIYRVSPSGDTVLVASMDLGFYGGFMGIAVDDCDRVYVAQMDFSDQYGLTEPDIGNAVWRVDGEAFTKVIALPFPGWPNGLAFHKDSLYIGDAARGVIWRARLDQGVVSLDTPWFQDSMLAPSRSALGINGIAFKGSTLYGVVSATGRVVRVPLKRDGTAGALSVLVRNPLLKSADGVAFDVLGRLWVVTNGSIQSPSGGIYRVSTAGSVTPAAENTTWLNYPTQPVFGRTLATGTTLFVTNGAYNGWMDGSVPNIIALPGGVCGLLR